MNMKKIEKRIETMEVETAFRMALQPLGGVDAFTSWAERNPSECRAILSKFIPGSLFQQNTAPIVVMCSPEDVLL